MMKFGLLLCFFYTAVLGYNSSSTIAAYSYHCRGEIPENHDVRRFKTLKVSDNREKFRRQDNWMHIPFCTNFEQPHRNPAVVFSRRTKLVSTISALRTHTSYEGSFSCVPKLPNFQNFGQNTNCGLPNSLIFLSSS